MGGEEAEVSDLDRISNPEVISSPVALVPRKRASRHSASGSSAAVTSRLLVTEARSEKSETSGRMAFFLHESQGERVSTYEFGGADQSHFFSLASQLTTTLIGSGACS